MKNTQDAEEALANVRRIIACVNACANIPTKELESRVIHDLIGALRWLLDDLADAEEDRNPETGEIYDSVAHAQDVLRRAAFPDLTTAE